MTERTQTSADAELLAQFVRGDAAAFEILFRLHQAEVYRWLVRIVRDTGAAEDLTLETFWRIYRSRSRFDPERRLGAWARRIATNLALEYLSAHRREAELTIEPPVTAAADPAVRADLRQKVAAAFAKLPARLRLAATLAMVEETPYAEIAAALGITTTAVKSRVFRAARLLRRSLERAGVTP